MTEQHNKLQPPRSHKNISIVRLLLTLFKVQSQLLGRILFFDKNALILHVTQKTKRYYSSVIDPADLFNDMLQLIS